MDIRQLNSAIMFGSWTDVELTSMIDAIKFARTCLIKQQKRALSLGTDVSFTSSKTGVTHRGKVEKIAQKFVTVNTGSGRWKVPANMLVIG